MVSWFAAYAAFAVGIHFLSGPAHRLPGYLPFELACLLPWNIVLFVKAARRGAAVAIAVLVTTCFVMVVTYPAHIITTLNLHWAYFQDQDVLIGPMLAGVPIEEFLFYPMTINLAVLIYLVMCGFMKERRLADFPLSRGSLRAVLLGGAAVFALLGIWLIASGNPGSVAPAARSWDTFGLPHYSEGPRTRGWTILCMFSAASNLVLLWLAELFTPMTLRAVVPTAALYLPVCLLVDLIGTSRGWWVFNAQTSSGLWIGPLPVEELPMYLTGVMLSISVFETTRRLLGERGLP